MRHILYLSGTRADYGLMRHSLQAIHEAPGLRLSVAATGMHLMPTHGLTINEIKADGFELYKLPATFERDNRAAMARFIGQCLEQLIDLCEQIQPDIILLLGDRGEMLAGAIAATYLGIPSAHIHGGEVTSTVDESARHAITKLAHLHFAATEDSVRRIIRLGENPDRVWAVGGPGLDRIEEGLMEEQALRQQLGLSEKGPFALVVQHPVSEEMAESMAHMRHTLEAVQGSGLEAVVAYPNADAGGKAMIRVIESYREQEGFHIFQHIPRTTYLSLMKYARVMVGNSSSGIIEAPSFQLPVVNVGTRQEGRLRGQNVIESEYDTEAIQQAIQTALFDRAFLAKLATSKNPYGDGKAAERMVRLLREVKIDRTLLQKKIQY
jgi:GDP/UDP-N,N'-diacetylbacillosamine 2-epimerase (hydrolysing)